VDASQLADLHEPRPFPAVSIIMPTHRRLPGRREDQVRLKVLLDEARHRLRELELERGVAEDIARNLEKAAEQVDFDRTAEALVLLAARGGETHSFILPRVKVRERVVIDDTFATRDLVAMLENTWRHWVVSIAKRTRLLGGDGQRLDEVENALFPMIYNDAVPVTDERGRPAPHEFHIEEERRLKFLRQIATNLAETLKRDPRPVVVIGVQRNISAFMESVHETVADAVIGTVEGNFDFASPAEIAAVVEPVLEEEHRRAQQRALAEIDGALSARRFASGLEECWELAPLGRIAHLMVEEDFFAPARTVDGRLLPPEEPEGKFVTDAVDDLVEAVLRGDGQVTFVPDGSLQEYGRVAAVLRY
jgi:thymidylate kinase